MHQDTTAFERAAQQAKDDPLGAFISVVDPTDAPSQPISGELTGMPYAVKDNIDTAASQPALTLPR